MNIPYIAWIYNVFIQSTDEAHLDCFRFGALLNNASTNILEHERWAYVQRFL